MRQLIVGLCSVIDYGILSFAPVVMGPNPLLLTNFCVLTKDDLCRLPQIQKEQRTLGMPYCMSVFRQ
jgi:hypothetical protein